MYNEYVENPRQDEYFQYLNEHISNVNRVWNEQLGPIIQKESPEAYYLASKEVSLHDTSKYDDEEFYAYCNHFYPTEDYPDDEEAFDVAWLRHQHLNPHHWQYWVLLKDSGGIVPQDIPLHHICNMLCDWGSFSAKDPDSTAYNWYHRNKNKMILSSTTRSIVEYLVEFLKEPLK